MMQDPVVVHDAIVRLKNRRRSGQLSGYLLAQQLDLSLWLISVGTLTWLWYHWSRLPELGIPLTLRYVIGAALIALAAGALWSIATGAHMARYRPHDGTRQLVQLAMEIESRYRTLLYAVHDPHPLIVLTVQAFEAVNWLDPQPAELHKLNVLLHHTMHDDRALVDVPAADALELRRLAESVDRFLRALSIS